MTPEIFAAGGKEYGDNLVAYWEHMRRNDIFACYLILTQQGARDPEIYKRQTSRSTALQVVGETDSGIILSGIKMLGTSAVFSDEAWIGNILPLAPEQKALAVTCAVPMNAKGVQIWVRKSFEQAATSRVDNYFSSQFDETDAVMVFDRVHVPYERVFVLDDAARSRDIYFKTPAHIMGNHQSIIRFAEKLKIMLAIAARAADMSGVTHLPAIQQTLGRLAASEALLLGLIESQLSEPDHPTPDYLSVNSRYLYAALNWCTHTYYELADKVKELVSAGPFQIPADSSIFSDADVRAAFEANWETAFAAADVRYKFTKLAWDFLGSEFASRHTQYERFYGGPPFLNDMYSYWHAPWQDRRSTLDAIMADMELPALSPDRD